MEEDQLVRIMESDIRYPKLVSIMRWASVEIEDVLGDVYLYIRPKSNQTRLYRKQLQEILELNSYRAELEFYWEDGFFVIILHKMKEKKTEVSRVAYGE